MVAFSSPTQSGDTETGLPLSEMLADTRAQEPGAALFSNAESKLIQQLLEQIDPREADILRMRYGLDEGEPMTLKDIGAKIGLTRERSALYRRIEDRVDRQMAQGLVEDVRGLLQRNYPADLPESASMIPLALILIPVTSSHWDS